VSDFPEPRGGESDATGLFARYLDYYRHTVLRKVRSLPEAERRHSRLPSGWTPLELVNHLLHMERRWFVWGFLGEDVPDPWGDDVDGRWHVAEDLTLDDLETRLLAQGDRTSRLLAENELDALAPPGPRFEHEPASLAWICFHVLQEYARHTGQLDAAVELAGGEVGE
jgi:uncharacterized damage-inducible protein DinB